MDKGISVIIACYNSSLLLRETIECIALQNQDNINVELIIVDNASDDNTYELALKYCKELLNITYRVEQQNVKGKNAALSLGYRLCRYSYVLICDDDNRLEPNYVKTAFAIMEANVSIGALGGIGYPIFEEPAPSWGKYGFACGAQGKESGDITQEQGWVYGAGSVYRLEVILELNKQGFQTILGTRRGQKVDVSGEDVEFCYALILLGYKIWYDERLKFKHYMPAKRMQIGKFLSLRRGDGVQSFALGLYQRVMLCPSRKVNAIFLFKYWFRFFVWNHLCLFKVSFHSLLESSTIVRYAMKQQVIYACKTSWNILYCYSVLRKFVRNINILKI